MEKYVESFGGKPEGGDSLEHRTHAGGEYESGVWGICMGGHGLNSLSIGYRLVAGCFELDSELLGYKEGKGILL